MFGGRHILFDVCAAEWARSVVHHEDNRNHAGPMCKDAPSLTEALISFSRFVDEDAMLIAHKAVFDMGFIRDGYAA